jgi:hypothetical protein
MVKRSASLWIFVFLIISLLLVLRPVQAGTLTGTLYNEDGDPMDEILVMAYTGDDPERAAALPEEISNAIKTRTDKNGNFSITIPDSITSYTLKVRVDTAYYNPLVFHNLRNEPGTHGLKDRLIATIHNSEPFWVTSDTNAKIPNTLSIDTNRWEQLKVRGKPMPIIFPETRIEPLSIGTTEEKPMEIRGFPKKK